MAIEKAPCISDEELFTAIITTPDSQAQKWIDKINDGFEYWDSVKYKKCPEGWHLYNYGHL